MERDFIQGAWPPAFEDQYLVFFGDAVQWKIVNSQDLQEILHQPELHKDKIICFNLLSFDHAPTTADSLLFTYLQCWLIEFSTARYLFLACCQEQGLVE